MIPQFLIEKLEKQYGKDLAKEIIEGYKKQRKVTFRVNNLKTNVEEIEKELNGKNIKYKKIPYYKEAFIIENIRENEIKQLDCYKNGEIYMQSLSSMLPPIVLNPKENENILDMAAAPRRKNNSNCSYNK